ncbi:hypothetical protein CHUAL_000666 [Chamberlinius hualienensis]
MFYGKLRDGEKKMADEGGSGSQSSNTVEIIQYFNSKNAKIVAFFLVLGFIIYHGIIHLAYGIDSCKWLLSDGRLQGYLVWQPYGCMMHPYSDIESKMCMRYIDYWGGKNHIVFVGDSRIRQLYYEMVKHFDPKQNIDVKAHSNLKFRDQQLKLTVQFVWSPMVNSSMMLMYDEWLKADGQHLPSVIVTGSATWAIKESNGSEQALIEYKNNLTKLVPQFNRLSTRSKVLWMLQDPVVHEKLSLNRKSITNELIDSYNRAALEILDSSEVHIWSSSRLVSQGYNLEDSEDGIHIGKVALKYDLQILLNMYCNDQMNFNDGTCCSSAETITYLQIITLSAFAVCGVLFVALSVWHWRMKRRISIRNRSLLSNGDNDEKKLAYSGVKSWRELLGNVSKLGLIMGYFYLCDRTSFFMKENKYYSNLNFFLPFAYVLALGLFFTEETQQTKVLHRDQTDEWKGWMQLIILIYHMTGASQVLPIYMHVRLLVTSYLFLSGYGHFTYLWHRADYGIGRLVKVLFRYNLLVVVLCLTMNRPYQFYYFVPLVSFWFLVVYATMATFPQVTSTTADAVPLHYLYIVLKFVGMFAIVTILFMSEVFFEKIFVTRPWKALFVTTDDSIKEWWFRWKIDRYSVGYGMMFAFAYYLLRYHRLLDDNNHGNLFSRSISCASVFFSVIGLVVYSAFALLCRNKAECNEVHPYLAFLPILSYVILRNISGLLRTRYSTFFAWFGKISLELFICQYHIWLSADTHGILVLVPSYPVLNVLATTFIFLCISHEIHRITINLATFAIPNDWKYVIRNVIIFLVILIPIGIHDGMF